MTRHRCEVVARNLRVGRAEIDLIVRDRGRLVAVEVKTRMGGDPRTRFDESKAATLRAAMARLDPPLTRLDLITVVMGQGIATIEWFRGL